MQHTVEEPFPSILMSQAQIRPNDEPLGRFYDPGRDVAHLAEPILSIACGMIDDDAELRELRIAMAIPDASLAKAVKTLVELIRLRDPAPKDVGRHKPPSYRQHAAAVGMSDIDTSAKLLILSAVGELFLVASWQGKRAASAFDAAGRRIAKLDTGAEVAEAARQAIQSLQRHGWRDRLRLAWRMLLYGK